MYWYSSNFCLFFTKFVNAEPYLFHLWSINNESLRKSVVPVPWEFLSLKMCIRLCSIDHVVNSWTISECFRNVVRLALSYRFASQNYECWFYPTTRPFRHWPKLVEERSHLKHLTITLSIRWLQGAQLFNILSVTYNKHNTDFKYFSFLIAVYLYWEMDGFHSQLFGRILYRYTSVGIPVCFEWSSFLIFLLLFEWNYMKRSIYYSRTGLNRRYLYGRSRYY